MKKITYLFTILICVFSFSIAKADFFDWHTTNIQLLKGWDYKVGEENRTIMTLEHANGFKYGDFFMFIDSTRVQRGKTTAYGEFSPRISLKKTTGIDASNSFVEDVLLTATLEKGKEDITSYLYGGAVDLKVPGFKFFKTNFYIRDNKKIPHDKTWQVTIAWNKPLVVGDNKLLFEGFADFAGKEGSSYYSNQLIVPRFLVDVGKHLNIEDGKAYFGVEWQYWHNKFGIKGVTESVPQLQFKWVF